MPKHRKQPKSIRWNLSDLYSSPKDPQIAADLQAARRAAAAFTKKYTGQIGTKKLTASTLVQAIKAYEAILHKGSRPFAYAYLLNSVESEKPAHGAFLQYTREQYTALCQSILWFELELASLDNIGVAKRLLKDPSLEKYKHFIEKQLVFHPHRLTEAEEKLLVDKSLTGRSAWERLFEQENASMMFDITLRGKPQHITQNELVSLLNTESDQDSRQEVARVFTAGLQPKLPLFTYITNMLAAEQASDTRLRQFDSPEHSRHLSNDTTQAAVDTLTQVVTDNYAVVQDFYKLKRKVLGLRKLYDYDRYAPISPSKTTFTWPEAQKLVLTAFNHFSPIYSDIAQEFFDKNWIDATPKAGKQGGAYCLSITPSDHPYILLNFNGSIESVITLAHELGHGIHAQLAAKQSLLNFDSPLTLAETASVFGEMLMFDYLDGQITDKKEHLNLYFGHIDRIIATVFRQISMYRFEQSVHKARTEEGELSTDKINSLWRQAQTAMFGNSVTITKNYDSWWSYIPHFIRSPFYVYAYAFGELLTLSLYARYKEQGGTFIPHLVDILKAGGSKSPQELLQPHGIDLESKEFWRGGMQIVAQTIEKTKELVKG